LCFPDDEAALPRDDTSLHGLREDSRFIAFSPSLEYFSPLTGDRAACRVIVTTNETLEDIQQRSPDQNVKDV